MAWEKVGEICSGFAQVISAAEVDWKKGEVRAMRPGRTDGGSGGGEVAVRIRLSLTAAEDQYVAYVANTGKIKTLMPDEQGWTTANIAKLPECLGG